MVSVVPSLPLIVFLHRGVPGGDGDGHGVGGHSYARTSAARRCDVDLERRLRDRWLCGARRAGTRNGRTIKTPLSGMECVWYRARLEQWRRGAGDDEPTWRLVRNVTSSEPFLFKDGSGTCVIFPDGAEVTFTDRSVWFGPGPIPDDKNPPKTGPADSPEGNVTIYGTAGKEYRYTEERIYAGDPLYVLGQFSTAKWDVEEEEEEEEAAEDDADESADDDVIAGAGSGDLWDPFEREDAMIAEAKITNRRVIRPPSQPYLLSTTPQAKHLDVQSKGWKASLGVAIVPAAIATLLVWLRFG